MLEPPLELKRLNISNFHDCWCNSKLAVGNKPGSKLSLPLSDLSAIPSRTQRKPKSLLSGLMVRPFLLFIVRIWPCPHYCVCVWKRTHFHPFRPSVHTNTPSVFIKNASIWKRSWKRIKTKTHSYRISMDGRKWKRWPKILQARVGSMRIEFILRHVQFYRFRTF